MATLVEDARRHLEWPACLNVRDTGGYPADRGGETRWRALVRADSLCQLNEVGCRALVDYGVRTVIDLRSPAELAAAPHPFAPVDGRGNGHSGHVSGVPATLTSTLVVGQPNGRSSEPVTGGSSGVAYLNVSIVDVADPAWLAVERATTTTRELNALLLEWGHAQVGAAVRAFAHAADGGVLVHCYVGKDRTGIVTACLLALAGVPAETIAADYGLSNRYLRPVFDELVQKTQDPARRARLESVLPCWPENMLATLELLRTKYGGVADYLGAAGVSEEDMERVRSRLRA